MFSFTFTEAEVDTILSGLGELPAKYSAALLGKMHIEVSQQLEALKVEPVTEEEVPKEEE